MLFLTLAMSHADSSSDIEKGVEEKTAGLAIQVWKSHQRLSLNRLQQPSEVSTANKGLKVAI